MPRTSDDTIIPSEQGGPGFNLKTDTFYRDGGICRTYLWTFHVLPFEHLTWQVSFDFQKFPFLDLETQVIRIQNK